MKTKFLDVTLNIKAVKEDGTFSGYGSVFNVKDSYNDIVVPGAFKQSLEAHNNAGTMPALLWMHDSASPIGVFTLMTEDSVGLYVEGKLFLTVQKGLEAHELLKGRAINGLSIGYVPKTWEYNAEEKTNYLKEVDLWECSLVTFPANTSARVSVVKAIKEGRTPEIRELEAAVREELGLSCRDAKNLMNFGYRGLIARDEQAEADTKLADAIMGLAAKFNTTTNGE